MSLYRCRGDGCLVIETQGILARHAGHQLAQPVFLTWIEKTVIRKSKTIKDLAEVICQRSLFRK